MARKFDPDHLGTLVLAAAFCIIPVWLAGAYFVGAAIFKGGIVATLVLAITGLGLSLLSKRGRAALVQAAQTPSPSASDDETLRAGMEPQYNVDGTPMVGSLDIRGKPYGQTETLGQSLHNM